MSPLINYSWLILIQWYVLFMLSTCDLSFSQHFHSPTFLCYMNNTKMRTSPAKTYTKHKPYQIDTNLERTKLTINQKSGFHFHCVFKGLHLCCSFGNKELQRKQTSVFQWLPGHHLQYLLMALYLSSSSVLILAIVL
jgi:hypothetical protein